MEIFSQLHPLRVKRLKRYIARLPGLVGYWPLWEGDGATARNYAPANLNTYNGEITGATLGVEGKVGRAFSFDGIGDYIVFTGFPVPTTTLSVGFIYRRTAANDAVDRVLDWQDSGPEDGFTFMHPSADPNLLQFTIRNGTTTVASISGDAMTLNQWYMFVGTYEVDNVVYYQDGVSKGTDSIATMVGADATLTAMVRAGGTGNPTTGGLQHMFVVNGVLTAAQVLRLAQIAGVAA